MHRLLFILMGTCECTTAVLFILLPLTLNSEERDLPVRFWLPFPSKGFLYWIIYSWQVIILFTFAAVNVSVDGLFIYFIMQTCAQFDILRLRLSPLFNQSKYRGDSIKKKSGKCLNNCIKHHIQLFE